MSSADGQRSGIENGIRAQLEKEMVQKVVSILEPVAGKGKVHANASLDLDFKTAEQTEETFNPNPPAISSQQKSEERVGAAKGAGGVPGLQPAATATAAATATGPERSRQSEVTNYEVSKVVRHTVEPQGRVKRLSVAVLLDHKTTYTKGPDGKVVATPQARPPKEIESYRELVLAAIGFDKSRGDVLTLENVPFYSETRPEEEQPKLPWHVRYREYTLPAMKYTAFLLLFLLAYFTLLRPMRKRVLASLPSLELAGAAAGAIGQATIPLPQGEALPPGPRPPEQLPPLRTEETAALPEADINRMTDEDLDASLAEIESQLEREFLSEAKLAELGSRKHSMLRKRLTERAKREPEQISQLLRAWMQEKEA
jgi:flagellar biosynthesis/type III secretory pathway M-ring protein FliF/YscJ